jgi:hypothetical protein
MSFDIFLQDFSDDASDRSQEVFGVLRPFLDPAGLNVITADGSAAVYGLDSVPLTGLMLNRVAGDDAWRVIYEAAVAADWVVMPVGRKICIVREAQRSSVPEGAAEEGIALVQSGTELKDVVVG